MEELWELRRHLEAGDVPAALAVLDEMEEMARDDKIQKIASYMRVLLMHLIKQQVEKRTTKSWDVSIRHALRQIILVNKRRKSGGWYLPGEDVCALLGDVYDSALDWASLEACEGIYSTAQLATLHDRTQVLAEAWEMISAAMAA